MILLGLNYTTRDSLFHYVRISIERGSVEGRGDVVVHCQLVKYGVGRRWSDQHNDELQQIRLTSTRRWVVVRRVYVEICSSTWSSTWNFLLIPRYKLPLSLYIRIR